MDTEKQHDGIEVPEEAGERNNRLDAFMGPQEWTMVGKSVEQDMGLFWGDMDAQARDRRIKEVTANIIIEMMKMSGGIWNGLSPEEKREMFRARFIEHNPAVKGGEASEKSAAPAEPFPDMDVWVLVNEDNLRGMNLAEKVNLYQAAKAKAAKLKN